MFLEAFHQARIGSKEIVVSFSSCVVPKGNFQGFFFNDPVALHVVDIKGRDVAMLVGQFFEFGKFVGENLCVFQSDY